MNLNLRLSSAPWLVCEAAPRWASAIRAATARSTQFGDHPPRLRELRKLSDLAQALSAAAPSFVCIEIGVSNLAEVLAWLPRHLPDYPGSHAVAGLASGEVLSGSLHTLLLEAGFLCVSESPYAVQELVDLGRRHDILALARQREAVQRLSAAEQVLAGLPWQPDVLPLG